MSAPVGLLERLAVPSEHLPKALASLVARDHVLEAAVLSTCNRVEVYAHVTRYHGGMADLRGFLAEFNGVPPEDFAEHCYDYHDDRAAAHLFAVASGLDSMVVGERQIHLQVKQALRVAEAQGAAGRVLRTVFGRALGVGRRARAETGIGEGASSMVDVGLDAAEAVLGDLAGTTVLLVGTGKLGGMAAARLRKVAGRLLVANRTFERAERLAARTGAQPVPFAELARGVGLADLVLTSTGAAHPLLSLELVDEATAGRRERPLVLLDLAVPRDVDPACGIVPGVTVLDIDAVRELTDTGRTGVEAARARALVEEETARFAAWTRAVHVEPTIAALRERAELVRRSESARASGRLGDLDERQRRAVDALTRRIVNTLLHDPSVRLKRIADTRGGEVHAAALRELFDLPDE
ncbi:MAG: glutamyl-tRNA reductase [Actinobacteria bacterium]|nr:glutamyl-tRNA reductase [Actinomycetota bacterium]